MNTNSTVFITGASSGIGLHLAHEFGKHGHRLILVAPDGEELQTVANELQSAHGVAALAIPKDLENENAAREIADELRLQRWDVDVLVNNAGHGFRGAFHESPLEDAISMARLNVEAVLRMTHEFLPQMVRRGSGGLFVTASVAGFEAGPMLAVYHATKAFVLSFTEALAVELDGTGVSVTALCPGPTDTDFFPKAEMTDTVAFQKASVMAPQDVAEAGYKGFMDGELLVIPGIANKALVQGRRFLTEKAQAALNAKMYEEVDPEDRERERGDFENKEN